MDGIPEGFEEVTDHDSIPAGFEEVHDEPGFLSTLWKNTQGLSAGIGDLATGAVAGPLSYLVEQAKTVGGKDPKKALEDASKNVDKYSFTKMAGAEDMRNNGTYKMMMKPFELIGEGINKGVEALGGGDQAKLATNLVASVLPIPGAELLGKGLGHVAGKVDPGLRNAMKPVSREFDKDVRRNNAEAAKSAEIPPGFEEVNPAEVGQQGEVMQPINPYDVGGHVTAHEQGNTTTIDQPQGDLFGHTDQPSNVPAELLRDEDQAKTQQFTDQAQQPELFDPYTNSHREFDQFSNDELPRQLTREEFEDTVANLEKENGTVYQRPEDMDAAYEHYQSQMQGDQGGLFDRPSQQEAFARTAQEESQQRIADTAEQAVQDHPLVRGARTHLANQEAKLQDMTEKGSATADIQAQQLKVAAAEKRLETTQTNLRKGPIKVRGRQQGMVDPKVFGEALSKGLDKLGDLGKPLLGAVAKNDNDPIKHVPGLDDYKPINTPEQAKSSILETRDIKPERAQSISSGARNLGIRSGHPLVRFFSTVISDRIDGPAKYLIDTNLNAPDGVATLKNKLKPEEFQTAMKTVMEGDNLGRNLNPEELAARGLDQRQIDFIESIYRNNESIWKAGGKGPKLEGYFPHNFSGDYIAIVHNKNGDPVYVLNAKNQGEFNRAKAWAEKNFDREEYTITDPVRRDISDRPMWDKGVIGIDDLNAVLGKGPLDQVGLQGLVAGKDLAQTRNIYNFGVHDKTRSREKVGGFDGNKPWKTEKENLDEAYESYVRFSEQGYYHHTMEQPLNEVKQLLNDPEVQAAAPNAVDSVNNYMKNITGQPTYFTGKALDTLADGMAQQLGYGRNAPRRLIQELKSFTQIFQLGIDLTNAGIQLLQPIVNGIPQARVAQKLSGLTAMEARKGAQTAWIDSMKFMLSKDKPEGFIKDALDFADKQGLMSFSETEAALDSTKGRVRRGIEKVGNTLPRAAEAGTRAPFFITMSGILREAWSKDPSLFKDKGELFQTAKNMTQSAMVDYSEFQRPYAYRKYAGTVGGSLLGQFKTYMHGQLGFLRTLAGKDKAAFAAAVGMMVYFAGIEGLPGYQDANNLVKQATAAFSDEGPKEIRDLAMKNLPEWAKSGGLSSMTGVNFQSRFGFSPLVDDNLLTQPWKISPATSTVGDMIGAVAGAAKNPDLQGMRNLAYQASPRQLRGLEENAWFKKGQDYLNPKTGMKELRRTPEEWNMRNYGLTSLRENREREDVFQATQQQKFYMDKQNSVMDDPIREFMATGQLTPATLKKTLDQYLKYKGDPATFMTRIQARMMQAMQTRKQRGQGIPNSYSGVQNYQLYNQKR